MSIKHSILSLVLLTFSHSAFAHSVPQFDGIAKGIDGKVLLMSQYEAEKYCADKGNHLPSAREWAQFASGLGAAGIVELDQWEDRYWGTYYLIPAQNSEGIADHFYYAWKGYRSPQGELGKRYFWSSSLFGEAPELGALDFDGENGSIDNYLGFRSLSAAVCCVKGR